MKEGIEQLKKELVVDNIVDFVRAVLNDYKPIEFYLGEEVNYIGWNTTAESTRYGFEKSSYVMSNYFRLWKPIKDIEDIFSNPQFIVEIDQKYGIIGFSFNRNRTNKVKLIKK